VPASPRASRTAARGRGRGGRGGGGRVSSSPALGGEAKKPAGQRPRGRPRKQPVKDDAYGSSDEELAAKNDDEAEEEEEEERDDEEEDEEEEAESSALEENDQEEEKENHDEKHESEGEGMGETMKMKKLRKRKRQVDTPKATELERRRPLFTAPATTTATRPPRTEPRGLVEVEVDQVAEFLFLSEPRGGGASASPDGDLMDDEDHASSGRIVSTIGDVAFLEETIDEKQRREAREKRSSRAAVAAVDSSFDEGAPSAIAELLGDADLLGRVGEALAEGLRRRSSNGDHHHAGSATEFVDTIVRESERLDRQVRALKAQQRVFGDLLCAMLGRDRRPSRETAKAREAEARRQELRGARAEAEAEAVRQRQRADQAALELASERLKARQHEELLAQAHREMESLRRELVQRQREADAPQPVAMTLTSPAEAATQAQAQTQQEDHQDHSEKQAERHDDEDGDDDNHDQHGGDDVSQQHFSPISEDLVDPAPSSVDFIEFI
jgi:hypothetical protein